MTVTLQAIALLMGGVYNSLLTYEAYEVRQKPWRILASAATSLVLFGFAGFKFGVLG